VTPNPAPGRTSFVLDVDRAGPVRMSVVDVRGRLVRRFEDSLATPGSRTVMWDGRDAAGRRVPAGVYLVTLEAGGRSVSSRVSLVK
jgi:flagellar hook assembly protein FlgD